MKWFVSFVLVAGLLAGCGGEVDLDDKETLDEILAGAIDDDKLQERGKEGEELHYAPNQQTPYTGWAKSMHDNGQIMELGHYKDGKANGQAVVWYENGHKMSEASFKDGKKNGLAKVWYSDGQKKAEGNFKDGKMEGLWTERGPRGEKIEASFKDGKKDGLMTTWHGNVVFDAVTGRQRKQNFQRGQKRSEVIWKDGEETSVKEWNYEYYPSGQMKSKYTNTYKDGLHHGLQTEWHSNGQKRSEHTFKDGIPDGLRTIWYDNGQKAVEANWKDGNPDGLATSWYENGQKRTEHTFKDGKMEGLWTNWYDNGQKKYEWTYKDNKPMSAVIWKPNGKKCPVTNVANGNGVWVEYNDDGTESYRSTYKDGLQHGLQTEWHSNGQKRSEDHYKDGKLDGPSAEWYSNGQKRSEHTFKDGKLEGLWANWYDNGQKMYERNYKDSKLMTAVAWKLNGEKCPRTNVANGNGFWIQYRDDGTEGGRWRIRAGTGYRGKGRYEIRPRFLRHHPANPEPPHPTLWWR